MQKKITISLNAEQIAFLSSFLPEGETLTGENIKEHIIRPLYDLPRNKQGGRPKGTKKSSTNTQN